METLKQANYASKIESVKNRSIRKDLNFSHISATPKLLKN